MARRPARTAGGERGRFHHGGDDGAVHLHGRRTRRGAASSGWDVETAGMVGGPRSGSSSARSATAPSISPVATSASARRSRCRATSRAASGSMPCARRSRRASGPAIVAPAGRQHPLGRVRRLRRRRSRRRTRPAPGCTSTARSGCGRPRRRGCGTSRPVWMPPTRGRPTRTRRSTCPTTAASRSSATGVRCIGRSACTRATCRRPTSAPTRTRRSPNCPAGRAACRRGRSLRSLGRTGVAALVERLADSARGIADGVGRAAGRRRAERRRLHAGVHRARRRRATEALSERLWDDGEVLAMTSRWHDRAVVRFSVSNWRTDAAQVRRTVDAVARALAEVRASGSLTGISGATRRWHPLEWRHGRGARRVLARDAGVVHRVLRAPTVVQHRRVAGDRPRRSLARRRADGLGQDARGVPLGDRPAAPRAAPTRRRPGTRSSTSRR